MDWYVDAEAPGAMSRLRHEVVAYLHRHADDTRAIDEAELVVSEVIGNTVRHARGPVWVTLSWPGVSPRLTVRDLGPGFDPHALGRLSAVSGTEAVDVDPSGLGEGGRGFFLVSTLAEELRAANRDDQGALVSVLLPVHRSPSADHDPPRGTVDPLPALSEALPDGAFGKESFLRALVVQLARTLEFQHGPEAAAAAVAQVGADVGGQMEQEYRLAQGIVDTLTPQQMGECYVRLKHAIDGDFTVIEANEQRIVLTNTRCPFGDVVRLAPSLCRMTSSVFGGIAAHNSESKVAVLLEERIAVGDPGCRVVVDLLGIDGIDHDAAHIYARPTEAV